MKNIQLAQRIYESAHGRFALTVDELNTELGSPLRISQPFDFLSDGTTWSVNVPKNPYLPGNYLLSNSGDLFFNELRIPTTNDLTLAKFRK